MSFGVRYGASCSLFLRSLLFFFIIFLFLLTGQKSSLFASSFKTLAIQCHVKQVSYCRLQDFAKTFDFEQKWDKRRTVLTFSSKGLELRFLPYNSWFWANDKIFRLKGFIHYYEGYLVAPIYLKNIIEELIRKNQSDKKTSFTPQKLSRSNITSFRKKKESHGIHTVMIDPGHGGKDKGAVGARGLQEKNLVLDVAKVLKNILEQEGMKVLLTRDTDEYISLRKRSELTNRSSADLFISLHANSSKNKRARGLEVFYLSDKMDDYARALMAKEQHNIFQKDSRKDAGYIVPSDTEVALSEILLDVYRSESFNLSEFVLDSMVKDLGLKKRGVKGARFYVIKNSLLPAILIEIGFISNPLEVKFLRENIYKVASSIATGVLKYKNVYDNLSGDL
ncbi:hypothetical protein AB834_05985 [PVC group bacterium (ex Bugula neritina AB1)]|nr:hypothetical protein AB834_05985 [PVC group bacterium (ex Bugula neritina AB1)]